MRGHHFNFIRLTFPGADRASFPHFPRFYFSKIAFLFLIVSLATTTTPLHAQTNDYFPLQVGNTWVFDLYEWPDVFVRRDTISIIDSLTIDSKTWFLFNRYFTIHELEDSVYLRAQDDKVIRYQNSREELWFDFAANEGDSWQIKTRFAAEDTLVPVTVELVNKNFTFSANDRTFENCYYFGFDFAVDYGWSYVLAPNFGCVSFDVVSILPRWYVFRSGTISGVFYPDLVASVESENTFKPGENDQTIFSVYPNPFNTSTRIVINTAKAQGHIKPEMYIYNINGRIIKTFSLAPAHATQIIWNGKDDNGVIVPSGVYFVSVRFGRRNIVKKVTFVR